MADNEKKIIEKSKAQEIGEDIFDSIQTPFEILFLLCLFLVF